MVADSLELIRLGVKWREDRGIEDLRRTPADEILGCPAEAVTAHLPVLQRGFDKEGRPIFYQLCEFYAAGRLLKATTSERYLNYHVWKSEMASDMCVEQTLRQGTVVDTFCIIIDCKRTRLKQASSELFGMIKGMAAADQNGFPERLGVLFIVNVPRVFNGVWAVISRWLDERTNSKIRIFRDKFEDALLSIVPAHELPRCTRACDGDAVGEGG